MNPDTRPNIITVGALGGSLSWFICFGLARAGIDLGAEGGIAMSVMVTFALQWADRYSKRSTAHVITKHGSVQ